ncbi:MAG: 6-phosphofructokinase [Pseudobdellovibrionaceae bacterium]
MKKILVFTSGGDAPGMNAAIRAVVRMACLQNIQVVGAIGGYAGILNQKFQALNLRDAANIIQRGGTILKTGRCLEFLKPEGRQKAALVLQQENIDGIVCIGGDGSFRGAQLLAAEHGYKIIGVPGTIDNDIFGSEDSIGFDTAVNTALEAIDRIRDTAASHDRLFIVEVMGRNSGFIASHVGLAGGAEDIFTPDGHSTVDKAIQRIQEASKKGKTSSILITAEGQKPGRAYDLADSIRKKSGLDAKVCILGHQQRGGSPTAHDRILASRMGASAVHALLQGKSNIMIGTRGNELIEVPFDIATQTHKKSPLSYVDLALQLAT